MSGLVEGKVAGNHIAGDCPVRREGDPFLDPCRLVRQVKQFDS
jgi:hypothetical protein